ncbi:cytochrome P450 [Microbacterium sp. GXF7504]
MTNAPATSDIDLWADEVLIDPYPTFAALRELGSVVHLTASDVYAITRYDAIREVLGDWEAFSSTSIGFNPAVNEALAGTSLRSDPPEHTQLRAVLSANLTPRALRGLSERIEEEADSLARELASRDSFEGVEDLARSFPLGIIAELIGFPDEIKANMSRWGVAANEVVGPMNDRTIASFPIAGELYGWCNTVTGADLAEGSIGRGIFDAEARGEIPAGSAGHIIHQYLAAGLENTVASFANMLALFGTHPEEFAKVRDDESLVASALNEVLRYWSPIHAWGRITTRDVEIDGALIPAGSQIAVLFGSGNHDERHFDDPETFDVTRNPVDHLSFGYGPHGCAGQGLARMEGLALIRALARHVSSFTAGTAVRHPANTTRSIAALPVTDIVAA